MVLTVSATLQLVHLVESDLIVHRRSRVSEVELQDWEVILVLDLSLVRLVQLGVTATQSGA